MCVSDELFNSLLEFYCCKNDYNLIESLKTLDNDIALVLNEETPLCNTKSELLTKRRDILEILYMVVSDENLLSHVYSIWTILEMSDQKRIYNILVGDMKKTKSQRI